MKTQAGFRDEGSTHRTPFRRPRRVQPDAGFPGVSQRVGAGVVGTLVRDLTDVSAARHRDDRPQHEAVATPYIRANEPAELEIADGTNLRRRRRCPHPRRSQTQASAEGRMRPRLCRAGCRPRREFEPRARHRRGAPSDVSRSSGSAASAEHPSACCDRDADEALSRRAHRRHRQTRDIDPRTPSTRRRRADAGGDVGVAAPHWRDGPARRAATRCLTRGPSRPPTIRGHRRGPPGPPRSRSAQEGSTQRVGSPEWDCRRRAPPA